MQATLARIDNAPPDWGQVGAWIAGAIGIVTAIWAGFKGTWRAPAEPPKLPKESGGETIAQSGQVALLTLNSLIQTLRDENERTWERLRDQDASMEQMRTHAAAQDTAIYRLQGQVNRLRAKLIENRIDPGDE